MQAYIDMLTRHLQKVGRVRLRDLRRRNECLVGSKNEAEQSVLKLTINFNARYRPLNKYKPLNCDFFNTNPIYKTLSQNSRHTRNLNIFSVHAFCIQLSNEH